MLALESQFPALATPDSPTQRVGAEPSSTLAKHAHQRIMLSLANAFDNAELEAWEARNARLSEEVRTGGYVVEVKIDGAAVSLTYDCGTFVLGATRGNGMIGEDITPNLRTVTDLPLVLAGDDFPARMEVRGEIYLPYVAFRRLNERREAEGEPGFANPRNAAAGALRQLDPSVTRQRRVRFFAFSVEPLDGELPVRTHSALLSALERWGFSVEPHRRRCATLAEVLASVSEFEALIPTLPFQADGMVVKVDDLRLRSELGVVGGRDPRWAIARKFAPEIAETTLRAIHINVGRTGALNPYAELEPVEVSGVTVKAATLHNEALIAEKDLRIGDRVEVMRAGEVIPQILRSLPDKRDGTEQPFVMPDECPACGSTVECPADEAMRYCPNVSCPGRVLEGIVHFASRGAMDIRGLGYERVRQLLTAGLIHNVGDLYTVTTDQLLELEGFADTSATQLVAAIAESKSQPLSLLLFGLGIRHVGKTVAQLLARHFGSLDALQQAMASEIATIPGIGAVIAEAVEHFLTEPRNHVLIVQLGEVGLTLTEGAAGSREGPLAGLTLVVTGTLPTHSRGDVTRLIELAGGRVSSSVSRKTDLLVAGDDAGSKLDKARALGVPVITEAELLRRIGQQA